VSGRDVHLQYDASLPHQTAAIDSTVDLFEGALGGAREVLLSRGTPGGLDLVELGFANPAPEDEVAFELSLLERLQAVQRRNGLEPSQQLDGRNFTVEMETGTGKTYVYLRTIFELHARYGLSKFVIVVPSVAIREGVLASLQSMGPHFRARYAEPIDAAVYDAKRLGAVRQFATASTLQVLVMNIQAFQKDAHATDPADVKANVINRTHDAMSGRRPIDFIQAVRPVVVIDEPQNFESPRSRAAIDRLSPLCTLRYSATPRNAYNLVYRLGPVDAFEQGLVKQIEVDGIEVDAAFNDAHVRLLDVDSVGNRARLEINVGIGHAAKRAKVWVKRQGDLAVVSRGRPEYQEGYLVDDIVFAAGQESVEFTGGTVVSLNAFSGPQVSDVQRMQISETIRYHLDRELALVPHGIKVLSLFFLDAVADYRVYGSDGTTSLGPVGEVFEEELAEALAKPRYAGLDLGPITSLHDAYFSQDAKGRAKDSRGDGEGDRSAYEKIMRGKEQLLSLDEPLRFIFTHSALAEGWDNPNVFQVCTLTHQKSSIRRRQQIGRGLRLPVDQSGARYGDRDVARLTVIANESYEHFARGLQVDYEQETGQPWGVVTRTAFAAVFASGDAGSEPLGPEQSAQVWEHLQSAGSLAADGRLTAIFTPTAEGFVLPMPEPLAAARDGVTTVLERYERPPVRNARDRKEVTYRKHVVLDPGFAALWRDIAGRTRYRVEVDSERIVAESVRAIRDMEGVTRALVRSRSAELTVTDAGIAAGDAEGGRAAVAAPAVLPDVLGHLQNATDLTRVTLARILSRCDRLDELRRNPHAFLVEITRILRNVLGEQIVDGIGYERVGGELWEMRQLAPEAGEEIIRYVDRLYEVEHVDKSPYSHVEWESSVERDFAERLDQDDRVRFFLKLPAWFTVDTPVGPYNPDWAIGWDDGDHRRVHLVRETKSTHDELGRRGNENAKITCAQRHFAALGTDYAVATSFDDLLRQVTR